MSKNWMNGIWSRDHCFNALALALRHGDPELARSLLMTQFDHQNAEGAAPDTCDRPRLEEAYAALEARTGLGAVDGERLPRARRSARLGPRRATRSARA